MLLLALRFSMPLAYAAADMRRSVAIFHGAMMLFLPHVATFAFRRFYA